MGFLPFPAEEFVVAAEVFAASAVEFNVQEGVGADGGLDVPQEGVGAEGALDVPDTDVPDDPDAADPEADIPEADDPDADVPDAADPDADVPCIAVEGFLLAGGGSPPEGGFLRGRPLPLLGGVISTELLNVDKADNFPY